MTDPLPKFKTTNIIKAIGWVTFLEILRDRILYNIILCAALVFGIGILAAQLSFTHPERIVLDFGLTAVTISCCAIAIFAGSGMLGREFERRTIHVALSHPITRGQFVLGKFVGLAGVLGVNWLLLSTVYIILLGLSSESWTQCYSLILMVALFMIWIESLMLAAIAILFSSFSTTSLSAIFSVGLYLVGNTISQIRLLADRSISHSSSWILKLTAAVLPNFEYFNFGTKVSYSLPVPWGFAALGVLYGVFMVTLCIMLAGWLIQGREV